MKNKSIIHPKSKNRPTVKAVIRRPNPKPENPDPDINIDKDVAELISKLELILEQTRFTYQELENINSTIDNESWQLISIVAGISGVVVPFYTSIGQSVGIHGNWWYLLVATIAIAGVSCILAAFAVIRSRVSAIPTVELDKLSGREIIDKLVIPHPYVTLLTRTIFTYTGPVEEEYRSPIYIAVQNNTNRSRSHRLVVQLFIAFILAIMLGPVLITLIVAIQPHLLNLIQ